LLWQKIRAENDLVSETLFFVGFRIGKISFFSRSYQPDEHPLPHAPQGSQNLVLLLHTVVLHADRIQKEDCSIYF